MPLNRQYLYASLKREGLEEYTDDVLLEEELREAESGGLLRDEAIPVVQAAREISPIDGMPGEYRRRVTDISKDLLSVDGGDALSKLRASLDTGFSVDALKKPSEQPSYMTTDNLFGGQVEEDEQDGFIWGNIKRGVENNFGLAKLMSGMLASGEL